MKWYWKIFVALALIPIGWGQLSAQIPSTSIEGTNLELIFHLQFLAVVLFVGIAAYLKYLQTWNPDFLYASLYLVVNFLYFSQ